MLKKEKRGQVTMFLILGVIIIVIIALAIYMRDIGVGVSPQNFLNNELNSIKDDVSKCIDERGQFVIDILGKQGGDLNPLRYRRYNGQNVAYLCENINGQEQCANRALLLSDLEKEIDDAMEFELRQCVDLSGYMGKVYDLDVGEMNVGSEIGLDSILIKVLWPMSLQKGDAQISVSEFSGEIGIPLGRIYRAVSDILVAESILGFFEKEAYILGHRNEYVIYLDKPYPDEIYSVGVPNHLYRFQFAVEGEPGEK